MAGDGTFACVRTVAEVGERVDVIGDGRGRESLRFQISFEGAHCLYMVRAWAVFKFIWVGIIY